MGEWDCYCMLCCGPLREGLVVVGDMAAEALRKRDKRVRLKARGNKDLAGVLGGDEMQDSDENDTDADNNKIPSWQWMDFNAERELYYCNRRRSLRYDYYEKYSYDPRIVTRKHIMWQHKCRTLGFNPDIGRAYITGLGESSAFGSFDLYEQEDDPLEVYHVRNIINPCYVVDSDYKEPTYPFHEVCYTLLAKRLGFNETAEMDKDIVYEVACALCEGNRACLNVDYGVGNVGKFWKSRPGEEYIVFSPEDGGLELRDTIWKRMPPRLLLFEPQPDLSHKVQYDPLTILPFDVLHTVIQYLSVQDTLNLMQASYHVCSTTRDPMFWRSMIRTHLAPWFWEIETLITGDELQGFDYKGLLLWLDKVTKPGFGTRGPFMGVANRRRIWSVCGVVADAYWAEVIETVAPLRRSAERVQKYRNRTPVELWEMASGNL